MNLNEIQIKNAVLKENIYYLTSDYKTRNEDRSNHNGMDFVGKNRGADYVIAIDDGVVITSKYSASAGYYVEIRHQNKYISRYLHLKKGSVVVAKGDYINKGDIIGYMGTTGNSTGVHLHFAVYNDKRVAQDPLPYLLDTMNFKTDYYHEFIVNVQSFLGAKVDGIAGPETLNKTITISATQNRKHKVVKYIQDYLYNIGYTDIGKADGIAGPKFTKTIKQYQTNNNCVVDGIITKGNKTWKSLLKLI